MEKTAAELQKERIRTLEIEADALLAKCDAVTLASVNEKGFPRICVLGRQQGDTFRELHFITGRRTLPDAKHPSVNGKIAHFEKNNKASVCYWQGGDSVTLIGTISFITDRETQEKYWSEEHRSFFKKGIDDPRFCLLEFHTLEATFWINGKFRTCKYR